MFTMRATIKGKQPRLPFALIAEHVLGKKYQLDLVLCSSTLSRRLNKTYRGKDTPTNILSFPLSENEGEIFIDVRKARSQAKRFGRSETDFILFLFIHGVLHLKGLSHGSRMEELERKIEKKFRPH